MANYHRRHRSEAENYSELRAYQEKIAEVVRKDRRNSPTFCNSYMYPLPCYRYL